MTPKTLSSNKSLYTRREILKKLGWGTTGLLLLGAISKANWIKQFFVTPEQTKTGLVPVTISRKLIKRTIVGLRPFRPKGYMVRSEKRGSQTLVHNYGHGGGGVTLSWGTAQMAVEHVLPTREKKIAVIGSGAVGLATARLLQEKGFEVTIYAREFPPHTTSDIAGARWYPFDVCDRDKVSPEFISGLWKASRFSFDIFKKMVGDDYGIYWRPTYACRNTPFAKESLLNFDSPIHDLLPGLRDLKPSENPFPYPIVRQFQTLMIEPAIYLPAIVRDYTLAGGKSVMKDFKTLDDVAALPERTVVNCTGLGAAKLIGDTEMFPIKGQLTILEPQPEVNYITLPPDLYMFPRHDGIVLGGTFERHIATMEPNLDAEERILNGHSKFFSAMSLTIKPQD